ncbi:MAG: HEAT repeat domain-containing protein [Candidatus Heimdallarchaeota archaeon]|nr:MAG: HEAT repeat domain-containing protein [Candidatus Heimdallarchaeota archaeon]
MSEIQNLESSDKNKRVAAAKALGNTRTKVSLRALLEVAEGDSEKDVRKEAIESLGKLNDPEAIPVLEKIAENDKDRGARNKAKDITIKIRSSGASLPETDFSEEDARRAREDFRALEEHEVKQAGLHVKLKETLTYRIDQDNNLIGENDEPIETLQGKGEIGVTNTGSNDRIWAIDAFLEGVDEVTFDRSEDQEIIVFGNSFGIKELSPQETKGVHFDFSVEVPQLRIKEEFWDLEKPDSPPTFSRGTEAGMRFTIELGNDFEWNLENVVLKKHILDPNTNIDNFKTENGEMRMDGDTIRWEIAELPANSTVQASCEIRVNLPEDTTEPYKIGDTVVTYHSFEKSLSDVNLETITGSSSVFQFISRDEQEENPGDFDCKFELENTSEFEMDLKEVRIYEGPLDEGNVRLEWLGSDFPEEERSIDPGETFSLDPWTITVEEDGVIPQFGRELDLSVKYLFDAEIIAECTLPGYALPFMDIVVSKTFSPDTIPSYRRTEIITENIIRSSGSTDVEYVQLQDQIPDGFEAPAKENITITKGDKQVSEDDFTLEITEENVIVTIERLEYSSIGTLKQDEEILVTYPFFATAQPEDEFMGNVTVLANIFPPVKPVSADAEAGPITVVHKRRKLKIGKMVRSTSGQASNEYEIVIRGENEGTAVIQNVEVSDFLPQGFELVSDTEEDPPVGFEEHSSVKNGRAMKWVYKEVQPGQTVEIRFKIRAPGEHDPKEVYRMLLG